MKRRKALRQTLCLFISTVLLTGSLLPRTLGQGPQRQAVIISFGQPNIWSLEQAHYLLARMRSQGLGLQSKPFQSNDLDPNDVNGIRLEMLKQLLGVGVGFSQAAGFQNQQATRELSFNQDRRHQLLAVRDQRQTDLSSVSDQLATLNIEKARLTADPAATDAAKALKDAEIAQQTARQTRLTSEVTALNSEINAIPATATALATPSPPAATASPLPAGILDGLLAGNDGLKTELGTIPKLNASTKLDNYLNLQYEIIAKQLTLLRDEAGPGQRLVFLELPQSFYTVPDKANRKMAQVWWHVDKYYERTNTAKERPEVPPDCPNYDDEKHRLEPKIDDDQKENTRKPNPGAWEKRLQCNPYGSQRPRDERDIVASIQGPKYVVTKETTTDERARAQTDWLEYDAKDAVRTVDLIPRQSALNVNEIQDKQKNFNLMGLFTWLSGIGISLDFQRERRLYEQFIQQDVYASAFGKGRRDFGWTFGPRPGTERIAPGLQNTYAVIAVPDKAEAVKLTASGCYFPRTAYAPNNFDDTSEFGDTSASHSSSLQCTDKRQAEFTLVVPSTTENNFWVTGVQYRRVRPGEQATVYIHGDYFSPQIGVLVNGVALRHSVGLAQPELAVAAPQNGFAPTPVGDFEFVNSKLIVLSFTMPAGADARPYKGTPTIALVTPGRARIINDLRLVVNDSYKCTTKDIGFRNCPCPADPTGKSCTVDTAVHYKKIAEDKNVPDARSIWVRLDDQPLMFSEDTPAQSLSVGELKVFPPGPRATTFRAQLTGSKFDAGDEVRINGAPYRPACMDKYDHVVNCGSREVVVMSKDWCVINGAVTACPNLIAPGLFEIELPATDDPTLDVTVVHKGKTPDENAFSSKTFPNPFALRVYDRVRVLDYLPERDPHPLLKVRLRGNGFTPRLTVGVPGANVIGRSSSPTTMVLDLELVSDSKSFVITLTDPQTGVSIPVVVNLPPEPKKASGGKDEGAEDGEEQGSEDATRQAAEDATQNSSGGKKKRPKPRRRTASARR
jgi:hypothetical protein